jgi:pimeloyl-[acyl-carrier protein] synthase
MAVSCPPATEGIGRTVPPALVFLDGELHTKYRQVMSPHLRIEPDIYARAIYERLASFEEFVGDVIVPASAQFMIRLLGLPSEMMGQLSHWARQCSDALDLDPSLDAYTSALSTTARMFRAISIASSDAPDGVLAGMHQALLREQITQRELLSNIVGLLAGGIDTTIGLITCGLKRLTENPHVLDALSNDPRLWLLFVDEVARLDSPAQVVVRYAAEDGRVDGLSVREGEEVLVLIASENRDPSVFSEPDLLRIGRERKGESLAFGLGPHRCIGQAIGRATSAKSLALLGERFPDMPFDFSRASWRRHAVFRSIDYLPSRPTAAH